MQAEEHIVRTNLLFTGAAWSTGVRHMEKCLVLRLGEAGFVGRAGPEIHPIYCECDIRLVL